MKKILGLLLVVAMLLTFAACSGDSSGGSDGSSGDSGDASGDSTYTIGVSIKTLGNPFFKEIGYGAQEMGKKLGVEVQVQATAEEGMLDEQIQMLENYIAQGVDALVVTPQHSSGISPAVEAAHSADVPFIAVDTNVEGADVECFVGMDNVEAGYIIGQLVCEQMGGEGNIIILKGTAGASTSEERTEGYKKAVAEYPGITIVGEQNADFKQDKAQEVMSAMLQSTDQVDGLLSCGDLMALGAITSLEEAGYTCGGDDGVVIGSYDISTAILEQVQSGKVYVEGYHWGKLYGAWGVEMAVRYLNGEPIPERVTSPHSEITAENVAPFLEFAKSQEAVTLS